MTVMGTALAEEAIRLFLCQTVGQIDHTAATLCKPVGQIDHPAAPLSKIVGQIDSYPCIS